MSEKTAKFGMTDWDQEAPPRGNFKKFDGPKDEWMNLVEGSNELRPVTKPFGYLSHKYKVNPDDKKDFGQKVYCSMELHNECPLCALGVKVQEKWYLGVIDLRTNQYKILDIGRTVYDQFMKLNRNTARWGDPQTYDIDIIKDTKASSPAGIYTVMPLGKSPLTEEQLKIKAAVDTESLARRCTPPLPKFVLDRVNKIRAAKNLPALDITVSESKEESKEEVKEAAPKAVVDSAPVEEDDMTFPAVEG